MRRKTHTAMNPRAARAYARAEQRATRPGSQVYYFVDGRQVYVYIGGRTPPWDGRMETYNPTLPPFQGALAEGGALSMAGTRAFTTILKERLTMGQASRYAAACSRNAVKRREDPRVGYIPVLDGDGTWRVERRGPQ